MKPGTLVSQALRILLGLALALFFAPRLSLRADQKSDRNADKNTAIRAEPQLTLEAISRDPDKWAGTAPTAVRWSEDSSKLDFQWNPERGDRSETYELDVRSSDPKPRKVADDEKRWLSSNPGERNRADTLKICAFQGDLYLHDLRTGKVRAITRTADPESNPRFSSPKLADSGPCRRFRHRIGRLREEPRVLQKGRTEGLLLAPSGWRDRRSQPGDLAKAVS